MPWLGKAQLVEVFGEGSTASFVASYLQDSLATNSGRLPLTTTWNESGNPSMTHALHGLHFLHAAHELGRVVGYWGIFVATGPALPPGRHLDRLPRTLKSSSNFFGFFLLIQHQFRFFIFLDGVAAGIRCDPVARTNTTEPSLLLQLLHKRAIDHGLICHDHNVVAVRFAGLDLGMLGIRLGWRR